MGRALIAEQLTYQCACINRNRLSDSMTLQSLALGIIWLRGMILVGQSLIGRNQSLMRTPG
jgi:hypothetical protein